ncbi:MAG: hypothetical protein JRC68_09785 [Deltaproteobacteria bacterium]|nr:hypothetical protein [Deltaproteobacteria bacterium]
MTLTKTDLVKGIMEKVHIKNRNRERQQFLFSELNYSRFSQKRATDLVDTTLARQAKLGASCRVQVPVG